MTLSAPRATSRRGSVKWNGREVENPVLRALCLAYLVVMVGLGLLVLMLVIVVVIPLSVPLHLLLRACGRRGFVKDEGPRSFSYEIEWAGFKKRC